MTASMAVMILKSNISDILSVNGLSAKIVDKVLALKTKPVIGRYDFADGIYMNVESYIPLPFNSKEYEAHRQYVDVQIILKGKEDIYVANVEDKAFRITKSYIHDIEFMDGDVESKVISLDEGEFCVLTPDNAHKPCIFPTPIAFFRKLCYTISTFTKDGNGDVSF